MTAHQKQILMKTFQDKPNLEEEAANQPVRVLNSSEGRISDGSIINNNVSRHNASSGKGMHCSVYSIVVYGLKFNISLKFYLIRDFIAKSRRINSDNLFINLK